MMRRYKLGVDERTFEIDVQELGADRFQVVVGDASYEVTLGGTENLPEATITPGYQPGAVGTAAPPPRAHAPGTPTAAAAPRPAARAGGAGGGTRF